MLTALSVEGENFMKAHFLYRWRVEAAKGVAVRYPEYRYEADRDAV